MASHSRSHVPLFPLSTQFILRLNYLLPLLIFPTIFLAHHIRKDYHAFLALGPGGTPSTPSGYLRICILRLFAVRDPFAPPALPSSLLPQEGYLTPDKLPMRSGQRPRVVGIAPHRQMTQKGTAEMYATLSQELHELVNQYPSTLYAQTSCFEKHSTGIFCKYNNPSVHSRQDQLQKSQRLTCNGEVCHAHPSDGSLHLTLHPADVRLVLEKGWGQRHPVAREDWWWHWVRSVPPGFVMIYAPRNEEELQCVLAIIRAATWWVRGEELPEGSRT
ncbi:hypothetical protein BDV25DRAFT_133301 [Aspergillus avenaceus]|uniref:Luciferase domain-containing protein n=1 Tax=Aspergillus avenaceus TaxID=36643 RepID=A0A5N6TIR8_ASPAV|nr:hypothetical protein BDV25DRAFT_133301 [Aspergillus avenaceus]